MTGAEIVFIVAAIVLVSALAFSYDKEERTSGPLTPLGQCPPHVWGNIKAIDSKGNIIAERMVCRSCGFVAITKAFDETK
jgi:hypothetical protein